MINLDKHEKELALQCFRATSLVKNMQLNREDAKYLTFTLFCYFYYDLEYYRLLNSKSNNYIAKANLAATNKATAMSNIVAFFESYHKDSCERLCEIFGSDEWRKFSNTVLIQEKRYY